MEPNPNHDSELERAEEMLYRPDIVIKQKARAKLHREHAPVPTRWESTKSQTRAARGAFKLPSSLFSKLFIGSIIFFVVAAAIAVITILTSANVSSRRINLEVLGRTFVDGGELLPLQVAVANNNNTQIELADLVVEYPTNTGSIERIRRSVGTVAARQQTIQDFDLTLFGEEGTVVPITVTLEYRIPDSNAILTKDTSYQVTLRSTPVVLTVLGPQSSLPNQQVTMNYTVVSNSATVVEDVALVTEYPVGFEFMSAEPAASFSNNVWVLGDLEPGATRSIAVTGVVRGSEGSSVAFKGAVGKQDPQDEKRIGVTFGTIAQPLGLESSFISTSMIVNDAVNGTASVDPGDDINIRIPWQNPLPVRVTDAVIEVQLAGQFETGQVVSRQGFYNSATRTIIFSKDNVQNLAAIEPGESGEFSFTLKSKQGSSISSATSEPTITLTTNVQGIVDPGNFQRAEKINQLVLKVVSDVRLLVDTQHFTGLIANDGPMPPKVGQRTTYTVAMSVSNSTSTLVGAKVVTVLPQYVEWMNVVMPQQTDVVYNPVTREVVWTVGSVEAGAGYSKPVKQASFKVGITPSESQVGSPPNLTGDIMLTGTDTFTSKQIQASRRPLTTRLLNDASSVGSDGAVVQ